ncbi:uncharacterized protein LOC105634534 [Jatropha curcas]|uniref:uncharacterized protein LOC105634534 n=1 Tax=Jatropha curcas TaxID=180498 RepID=UPI0005FB45F3|nr:uncharacterized protein LOC105634534 [Jatropha curcas]
MINYFWVEEDIIQGNGGYVSWNVDLVRGLFPPDIAAIVLCIKLSHRDCEDKLIWHWTTDGKYTTKSAYHLARNLVFRGQTAAHNVIWKCIWELQVPPKVSHFLWRACHDILPSKSRLHLKGLNIDDRCLACGEEETDVHALVGCPVAVSCWSVWRQWSQGFAAEDFIDWLSLVWNRGEMVDRVEAAVIVWNIWNYRNKRLWSGVLPLAPVMVSSALSILYDWQSAQQVVPPLTSILHHPTPFQLTGQVSVHLFEMSMILSFLCGIIGFYKGLYPSKLVETIGLREVLSWLKRIGLDGVIVEMDAQMVCKAVKGPCDNDSDSVCWFKIATNCYHLQTFMT